jgi:hypothetical protein
MKRRILSFLFLAFLCAVLTAGRPASADDSDLPVQFRWAFVARPAAGPDPYVPITRDTALKTGDQFRIYVERASGCYVYLIFQSSQNNFSLLFPADPARYAAGPPRAETAYIPEGNQWFKLDNHIGRETFYILASAERLERLETFLSQHAGVGTPESKSRANRQIIDEIKRLRWNHRRFKQTAERPVSVMGQLRGVKQPSPAPVVDIAAHAIVVSTQTFYSRTITIDHR